MAIRHVLANMSAFVNGRGYIGRVAEFNPPKLDPIVREYKAGGMGAEVAIPMGAVEKLEASFLARLGGVCTGLAGVSGAGAGST